MSTLRSRSNTATSPPATPSSRSSPTSESEVADATRTDSCGQDGEGQPQSVAVTREDSREDTSFQLYDLRVDLFCNASELSGNGGKSDGRNEGNSGVKSSNGEVKRVMCNARPTDYLTLKGEMLYLPDKQGVSIYSLAALLPLLPAKQRPNLHPNDWMLSDAVVACPDPQCVTRMRIRRTGLSTFLREECTATTKAVPGSGEENGEHGGESACPSGGNINDGGASSTAPAPAAQYQSGEITHSTRSTLDRTQVRAKAPTNDSSPRTPTRSNSLPAHSPPTASGDRTPKRPKISASQLRSQPPSSPSRPAACPKSGRDVEHASGPTSAAQSAEPAQLTVRGTPESSIQPNPPGSRSAPMTGGGNRYTSSTVSSAAKGKAPEKRGPGRPRGSGKRDTTSLDVTAAFRVPAAIPKVGGDALANGGISSGGNASDGGIASTVPRQTVVKAESFDFTFPAGGSPVAVTATSSAATIPPNYRPQTAPAPASAAPSRPGSTSTRICITDRASALRSNEPAMNPSPFPQGGTPRGHERGQRYRDARPAGPQAQVQAHGRGYPPPPAPVHPPLLADWHTRSLSSLPSSSRAPSSAPSATAVVAAIPMEHGGLRLPPIRTFSVNPRAPSNLPPPRISSASTSTSV
ncbi:hypothetical protein CVT26_010410 [Gymnopilus dilepis]|uniref:Uncharacterized protein n=1 Tax=Gymnopilus dilepis TaxID=231916 RepID=A0A409W4S0_9AGAR|nr:hypothetical protein CVT26_010410 [Gymnopilus dilepis]